MAANGPAFPAPIDQRLRGDFLEAVAARPRNGDDFDII